MDTKRAVTWVFICASAAMGILSQRASAAAVGLAGAFLAAILLPTWIGRRSGNERLRSDDPLLIRCINLFPLALGIGALNQKLGLLALVGLALLLLPKIQFRQRTGKGTFGIIIIVSLLHAFLTYRSEAALQATGALVLILLITAVWQSNLNRSVALEAVMDALAVYLVASVVAYYGMGLRSPGAANRIGGLTSSFGFLDLRVFFPFSGSMATAPVLASVYLCWSIPRMVTHQMRAKLLNVVGVGTATFVLMAAEYRMPILVLVLCLALGTFCPKLIRFCALPLALLLLFIPFWWNEGKNPARATISAISGSATSALQREGEASEISTLDNRTHLWKFAGEVYTTAPLSKQVFGWGHNGQVKSGASDGFSILAQGFMATPTGMSAHSTAWQTLLDGGLLGLLLVVALILVGLRSASSWFCAGDRLGLLLSPMLPLVALIATSGTEVTLAPGVGSEVFFVYILLLGVSVKGRGSAAIQLENDSDGRPLAEIVPVELPVSPRAHATVRPYTGPAVPARRPITQDEPTS